MEAIPVLVSFALLLAVVEARGRPMVTADVDRQLIVRAGETVRLNCPVDSDPLPIFTWFKDDESIHRGWERFRVVTKALKIKDIAVEDTGTYKCRATNGFGSVDVDYVVYVRPGSGVAVGNDTEAAAADEDLMNAEEAGEPPLWTHYTQMLEERHIRRPEGSDVRLRCHASGHPHPAVLWFYNNDVISGDEDFLNVDKAHEDHQALRLQNVQQQNNGNYRCQVFNHLGRINFTYSLEVVGRLGKPEIFELSPSNATIAFAEQAVLQCVVHSELPPDMKWLKRVDDPASVRDRNATFKVNGTHFVVLKTEKVWTRQDGSYINHLSIPQATQRDSGMYICLGANSMGYSFRSAYLTVLPPTHGPDAFSEDSGLSIPLIIAIPGAILIVIIIVIICFVRKKGNTQKPSKNRPQPRSNPQVPVSEKPHSYTAVPGYNNMQNTLSREQILNNSNPSDMNSDASHKMMPMIMPPQMSPIMNNYHAPQMHPIYQPPPHQPMHHYTYGQC